MHRILRHQFDDAKPMEVFEGEIRSTKIQHAPFMLVSIKEYQNCLTCSQSIDQRLQIFRLDTKMFLTNVSERELSRSPIVFQLGMISDWVITLGMISDWVITYHRVLTR
jgi:hypothetical protein